MDAFDEAAAKIVEYVWPAPGEAAAGSGGSGANGSPQGKKYDPGESPLVEELYRAYYRLSDGKNIPDYETLQEHAQQNSKQAASVFSGALRYRLIPWYCEKYPAPPAGEEGGRAGVDRGVGENVVFGEADYRFDEPLTRSVLEKYLLRGESLRTADARDFILHMAVAFHLTPETLDDLLEEYGFHPLHVKNVHHMAIYAVLRELETGSLTADADAFAAVKECFESAKKLLKDASVQPGSAPKAGSVSAYSTRYIRGLLASQVNLTRARVLQYIENNPELYGMRHERLLTEHKRLAYLFGELYDPHRANWSWENDATESAYCFYRFLDEFCKRTSRRHFNDQLYNWIQREGRHPTRELMISLWLYAYCFLFAPVIDAGRPDREAQWCAADKVPFSANVRSPEPGEVPERPFADYQCKEEKGWFRVLDYLRCSEENENAGRAEDETGTFGDGGSAAQASGRAPAAKKDSKGLVYGTVLTMKSPASGRGFSGSSLVTFINRKLGSYSWRPLDRHDPFDAAVQALGLLEVKNGPDGTPDWFYDKRRLTVPDAWRMLNVPLPLVLIVEQLHRVQLLRVQTDPQQKGKIVPFSKDFKCYELV